MPDSTPPAVAPTVADYVVDLSDKIKAIQDAVIALGEVKPPTDEALATAVVAIGGQLKIIGDQLDALSTKPDPAALLAEILVKVDFIKATLTKTPVVDVPPVVAVPPVDVPPVAAPPAEVPPAEPFPAPADPVAPVDVPVVPVNVPVTPDSGFAADNRVG